MNGITNYILLITLLIYSSRAPAQNVKQENDSVKMNKPFNMDIRTNIIYDALLIPNVGVEFDLGKRWTVAANAMPCMAGGTTTAAIATGEPTVVMLPCANGWERQPEGKPSRGIMSVCTARFSPTISKPVEGATWAASPVVRSGTR